MIPVCRHCSICLLYTAHVNLSIFAGDMQDPYTASWDPIFWLHHSNIERFQYAWIAKHVAEHGKPIDELMSKARNKYDWSVDPPKVIGRIAAESMIDYRLYPFPSRAILEAKGYDAMPWKVQAEPPANDKISNVREWFSNDNLGYVYDDAGMKLFGRQKTILKRMSAFIDSEWNEPHLPTRVVSKVITLANIPSRGPGLFRASIIIHGRHITLPDKTIFSFKSDVKCANCETRHMSLAWHLDLTPDEAINHADATLLTAQFLPNNGVVAATNVEGVVIEWE